MKKEISTEHTDPSQSDPVVQITQSSNFGYLFWEYGFPTPFVTRRPQTEANEMARENPDIIIQTGYYSLRLGCDDMQITAYDPAPGPSDYLSTLTREVETFTPVQEFSIHVFVGGIPYRCEGGVVGELVDSSHLQYVRLIESGRYVQRFDCTNLIFRAGETVLDTTGARIEVTAWPDHVVFLVDFSQATVAGQVERITILLRSPNQSTEDQHWVSVYDAPRAQMALKPDLDLQISESNPQDYITEATRVDNGEALNVSFDPDEYGFRIDLTSDSISWPNDLERVDEYIIELTNPSPLDFENVPLIFNAVRGGAIEVAITGTVMMLHDDTQGQIGDLRPSGIPVQVSKNWHEDAESPTPHEGWWQRGSTLVTLAPGQTRRFRLRVAYGNWAGAAAASYSQLSLIGWPAGGSQWSWDESALGAWGESMTYDPTQGSGSAMLCDIRPSFTTSRAGGEYDWTENVGGGDMLVYRDTENIFHWPIRIKTAYHWVGPNLAEVFYSGITDDSAIRFTYRMRLGRTNDYQRRFLSYKYEFLKDVAAPQRLLFFQMAADWYMLSNYTNYYIGEASGNAEQRVAELGGDEYKGQPFEFTGKFLVIEDTVAQGGSLPFVNRGLIHRGSTLNGVPSPVYFHPYGRTLWGDDSMLFDLSSDSVQRSYITGDVIEGEIGFLLTPKNAEAYWGADEELRGRLQGYTQPWQAVQAEMAQNNLSVTMQSGTLLNNYPIEITAAPIVGDSGVAADFTVQGGGIGHVPVILRNVQPGFGLSVQRHVPGSNPPEWSWLEDADIQGHNYYQCTDKTDGSRDYVYNIPRNPGDTDLNNPWRIRINQSRDFPRQDS